MTSLLELTFERVNANFVVLNFAEEFCYLRHGVSWTIDFNKVNNTCPEPLEIQPDTASGLATCYGGLTCDDVAL